MHGNLRSSTCCQIFGSPWRVGKSLDWKRDGDGWKWYRMTNIDHKWILFPQSQSLSDTSRSLSAFILEDMFPVLKQLDRLTLSWDLLRVVCTEQCSWKDLNDLVPFR